MIGIINASVPCERSKSESDGCPRLFRRTTARFVLAVLTVCGVVATGGCGQKGGQPTSNGQQPTTERKGAAPIPISNTDPCAMRLHDLCAPLLLYYRDFQSLPQRLEDLRQVAGFQDQVLLTCPTNNRPYVYNPVGVMNPDQPERVIVYDAEPHSGVRWAISIIEPKGDGPLITKVIGLQESQFHFTLPR
jgi:hypothetical protein